MAAKLLGRRGHRRANVMAEINVTPMVDVMLVLLIIFMVTAPLLSAGVAIDLPKARAKAMAQQDSKPIEITIDNSGGIYIGETRVNQDRMASMLQALAAETTDRRVYLKADTKSNYGKVMTIMAAINTAGFSKIALVTDPTTAQGR
ncbi:MAG TPA: protein TolR [Patescibacteria group bacterium]|nr:protein TolR [Patescibacteria group bacterium]